jgi:hypothetical protein
VLGQALETFVDFAEDRLIEAQARLAQPHRRMLTRSPSV